MKPSLNFFLILVCAAGSCWGQAGAPASQAAKELPPSAQLPAGGSVAAPAAPAIATQPAGNQKAGAAEDEGLPPKRKVSEAAPEAKKTEAKLSDKSDKSAYVIGPLDVLTIKVWNNANLSGLVDVGPDGMISMPLIGEVKADGLTARQLKDVVAERLGDFLNSPEVDVTVAKVNSKRYFVYGGVLHSGEFALVRATTVMDALSEVGGFRDFANTKKIYILRGTQKFTFNYKDVSKGKNMEQNILLQNGDRIFVPE